MGLPGVRSTASPEQTSRLAKRGCLPSVHERARIFLLLADVITHLDKPTATADVKKVGLLRSCQGHGPAIMTYRVLQCFFENPCADRGGYGLGLCIPCLYLLE